MATGVVIAKDGNDPTARRRAYLGTGFATALTVIIFSPILYYMVLHWKAVDDYSHGFLIGPLAIYFAFERRMLLKRTPIEPSWWGLLPLALGALALVVGRLGVELMAMRVSFVLTVIGMVLLLMGPHVFRVLSFPLLFLFLMVPLPQSLVNVIAFPLQLLATDIAVQSLHALHIPALREGNIIHLANTQLMVAEACSGLRSLMALGTLAIVFAYFFRKNTVERIILIVSALPIAILVNAFRVGLTGWLTHSFGSEAAEGAVHTLEGFFTFGLAFALLLLEAWLLHKLGPSRWSRGEPKRASA
ncbi:exosortase/archaeosortase family protein [Myxococcota bacterium]|nr:exosortase/archaeosortase family protein [Myxococcota bacterium]